jgi:hypothetical protein
MHRTWAISRSGGPVRWRAKPWPTGGAALLLALMGVATLMVLVTFAEGAIYRAQRGQAIEWGSLLAGRMADWYSCAILVPPLFWITQRWPIGRGNWAGAAAIHLAASLCAAPAKYMLYVPLRAAIEPGFQRTIAEAISADLLGKLMFFWAVIGFLHAVVYYRQEQEARPAPGAAPGGQASRDASGGAADAEARMPRIPFARSDIDWIEAQGNYVLIHAGERRHMLRHTMARTRDWLEPGAFVQVHRSAIVNADAVVSLGAAGNGCYRIGLRGGHEVTSGRAYRAAVVGLPVHSSQQQGVRHSPLC